MLMGIGGLGWIGGEDRHRVLEESQYLDQPHDTRGASDSQARRILASAVLLFVVSKFCHHSWYCISKTKRHSFVLAARNQHMLDLSSISAPADCKLCSLWENRSQVVLPDAMVNTDDPFVTMAIGEAPGAQEDKQGIPFVGSSGKELRRKLDTLLGTVVITNTVKCRPPDNRDPRANEKQACKPFLLKEIETIRPDLIVLVGRHALNEFLNEKETGSITRCSGKVFNDLYVPVIHPASILYSASNRPLWDASWEAIKEAIEAKLSSD